MVERIVCVGGINLDRKLRPLASLIRGSSNPCTALESPGGVARNVAENLARLGVPVSLVGAVGDDLAGRALLEAATASGIDVSPVLRLRGQTTDSYTALLQADGELAYGLAAMPLVERVNSWALAASRTLRADAACVVLDGNLPPDAVASLIAEGSRLLAYVSVSEPKMARLPQALHGLNLLLLNRAELLALDPGPDRALQQLHARGCQRVLVSLGAEGLLVSEPAGLGRQTLAAPPVSEVLDVTGAGDALAAGVCAWLCRRPDDLLGAARLGQHLAALTVQCEQSVSPQLSLQLLPP